MDVADRVLVIENGSIVHESLRADIDEAQVARFTALVANFLQRTPHFANNRGLNTLGRLVEKQNLRTGFS
jgi:ABC-type sugar transport system ATPase subunit